MIAISNTSHQASVAGVVIMQLNMTASGLLCVCVCVCMPTIGDHDHLTDDDAIHTSGLLGSTTGDKSLKHTTDMCSP